MSSTMMDTNTPTPTPTPLTPTPTPTPSATGLLSMLSEPSTELKNLALTHLLSSVDSTWHEVAPSISELETLAEDVGEDPLTRELAATIASRVFFHLEEPNQALRLALEGFSGTGSGTGTSTSGTGNVFECDNQAYVDCLIGAAVDAYVYRKKQSSNEEMDKSTTTTSKTKLDTDTLDTLDMNKLTSVVQLMFTQCFQSGAYEQALGVAFEACETTQVSTILSTAKASLEDTPFHSLLEYALHVATTLIVSKSFRMDVFSQVSTYLEGLVQSQKEGAGASGSAGASAGASAGGFSKSVMSYSKSLQLLKRAEPMATLIGGLLDGDEKQSLLGLQLCFDLMESGDQSYVNQVAEALPSSNTPTTTTTSTQGDATQSTPKSDEIWSRYTHAHKVLKGGFSSELTLSFLHKNSNSDKLIMDNLKKALEERGASRNSVLHTCAVMTHSYLNAGTTNDEFLRNNLEWMKKASNWAKFSATASLGVIHAGHITEAMSLLQPYLPTDPANADDPSSSITPSGGYSEGGSLYALGLIHGSDAGSSAVKRKETNTFLRNHMRNSHVNEAISHGAALGVGLTALGTNDLEIVNELKELLDTDSAVAGEGAGIAIGMVLVGSGAGNVRNNLTGDSAEEISEVITELKNYARETQHEKVIRGISMGLALINYGQEENADALIDEMRKDRDPILRYGAQYALALAYCGTGSNKAVRILLHTAVSDVSDDVRMAAVIALAFVLHKTPERVPALVKLLLESFNPHVRYASCMAVGLAMAGTGDAESVALLEPMLTDMTDYVRQGALIGTSLIYMQQGDNCNGKKVKAFREKLASMVGDKHQYTLTKMGAILSTGIIDAGGRNCSFNLGSKNGFTKMTSAVGAALWLQHWYWFPMMHMFSLAITPTLTIALNKDFKYPKGFEIVCNSKPSAFAYPKKLEEKKEEKKKRVETVTLSTTAKNKARIARKKAKEDGTSVDMDQSEESENDKEKKVENVESMDIDGKESTEEGSEEKPVEQDKKKKKREPEPTSFRLSNPCRITKSQTKVCTFDLSQRYIPVHIGDKPSGVMLVTDSTPGEEEDLGKVKTPSLELEGEEADPPEPFEWTPPGFGESEVEENVSL